jgi:hypothetical protein
LTVGVTSTPADFTRRFEQAVPPLPAARITRLVKRNAPWQEMLELIAAAAPLGFLIYHKINADPIMRMAGDDASCIAYLMGNHTIAERMFRHEPATLLYAPLRVAIWGNPEGPARFSFDKPSDFFSSFGSAAITEVGHELDRKVAGLLAYLGVDVPETLLKSG